MRIWLVNIRENQKKSQYEVADEAGMSQSYYASIETGARGNKLPVKTAKNMKQKKRKGLNNGKFTDF